jgi:uncharacterized protein GlcG (DUF336 family)
MDRRYVPYSDDLEKPPADEHETIEKITKLMIDGMHDVHARHPGPGPVRISHAKAHGFARGELVIDALPPELAQGLFATPGSHPVIVRFSQAPGELLDDRKVSSPRGLAIKIFDVEGEKLPGHDAATQDFVFDTGKVFVASNPKGFLAQFVPNVKLAPKLSDTAKGVVSELSRVGNAALHAVGADSPKLDVFGHPKLHPLGEAYYSQAPYRYGDYVCKLGIVPSGDLRALADATLDMKEENALRAAVVDWFRTHTVELDVVVQLMTDDKTMPIEDAMVEWPESDSPYRKVARIVLPPQNAYDDTFQDNVDRGMSFCPEHALAAHRPLGGIMRTRLAVYPTLAKLRRQENGRPATEPKSPHDIETSTYPKEPLQMDHEKLRTALRASVKPSGGPSNGGLDNHMWAAVIDRTGKVLAVCYSGDELGDQWPASRVIAISKANTANGVSLPRFAFSTAQLYAGTQPGGFMFGLQQTNPVDTATMYAGDPTAYGTAKDPMVGQKASGVVCFAGGLPLYDGNTIVGALGVSGDTSPGDHNVAWRVRKALGLDKVPAGSSAKNDDAIIYDIGMLGKSSSGFGHPVSGMKEPEVAKEIGASADGK